MGSQDVQMGKLSYFWSFLARAHCRGLRPQTHIHMRPLTKTVCLSRRDSKRVCGLEDPLQHSDLGPDIWTSLGAFRRVLRSVEVFWGRLDTPTPQFPTASLLMCTSWASCGRNPVPPKVPATHGSESHGLQGERWQGISDLEQDWPDSSWKQGSGWLRFQRAYFGLNQTQKGEARRALWRPRPTHFALAEPEWLWRPHPPEDTWKWLTYPSRKIPSLAQWSVLHLE